MLNRTITRSLRGVCLMLFDPRERPGERYRRAEADEPLGCIQTPVEELLYDLDEGILITEPGEMIVAR